MSVKLKNFTDPKSNRSYIAVGYVEVDEDPNKDWPYHAVPAEGEDSYHGHYHEALQELEKGLVRPEPLYSIKGE